MSEADSRILHLKAIQFFCADSKLFVKFLPAKMNSTVTPRNCFDWHTKAYYCRNIPLHRPR